MNDPIVPPPATLLDAARMAAHVMSETEGAPRVVPQLASGSAVHFGDVALFIPGTDPTRLLTNVHQKIKELACAYTAWVYAVENEEREEMS